MRFSIALFLLVLPQLLLEPSSAFHSAGRQKKISAQVLKSLFPVDSHSYVSNNRKASSRESKALFLAHVGNKDNSDIPIYQSFATFGISSAAAIIAFLHASDACAASVSNPTPPSSQLPSVEKIIPVQEQKGSTTSQKSPSSAISDKELSNKIVNTSEKDSKGDNSKGGGTSSSVAGTSKPNAQIAEKAVAVSSAKPKAAASTEVSKVAGDSSITDKTLSATSSSKVKEHEKVVKSKVKTSIAISSLNYNGKVKTTEADEYIELINKGKQQEDVSGWTILAVSNNQKFVFPSNSILKPGTTVRIYTNEIHKETGGFNFNSGRAIWNNKGGVAKLLDAESNEILTYSYDG